MLRIIQTLDPPGVGARDLRECLLLQLRELGQTETLTYRLVAEAFPDLIAHRWNDLAKRFGVPAGTVQAAADALARSTRSRASSTPARTTATSSPT